MKQRLISAAIMIAIGLPCILLGGWPLRILLIVIAAIMAKEITNIKISKNYLMTLGIFAFAVSLLFYQVLPFYVPCIALGLVLVSLVVFKDYSEKDVIAHMVLSLLCAFALYFTDHFYDVHRYLLLYALITSLLCDAAAYFIGSAFGKHKLAPKISPKKSIEGAIGGIVIATAFSFGFAALNNFFGEKWWMMLIISFVLTVISEFGDLFFSYIKRYYGIKDYGKLIPGHGGVLDRLDSVIFVNIVLGIFIFVL